MKQAIHALVLTGLLAGAVSYTADAQVRMSRKRKYMELGLNLNATNYFGDVTPGPSFLSFRPGSTRFSFGASLTKKVGGRVFLRGGLNWGRFTGDDAKAATTTESEDYGRWQRNLSFRNDIKELSFVGQVYLFQHHGTVFRRPDINPYLFGGLAVFAHNPKTYYEAGSNPNDDGTMKTGWYDLQPLRTEGQADKYSKVGMSIPFGLGVTYKLDRMWNLSFEIGWRKTFTDYLDDVSTTYADKGKLQQENGIKAVVLSDRSVELRNETDPAKRPLPSQYTSAVNGVTYQNSIGHGKQDLQRGDKFDNDWYILTGFRLGYMLLPKTNNPKFR